MTCAMQADPYVLSRLRVAFGTFVAVDAESDDPGIAARGLAAAYEVMHSVERLMHPLRAGSDLARLSACPAGTSLAVHPWTFEVLELCRQLSSASKGIFDPCLPACAGRLSDLRLLSGSRVRPAARLRIDLGGVAKGYAVDRAIEALRNAGCSGGLVNAGGDLAVFGPRARRILCRQLGDSNLGIELRDAALATSAIGDPGRPSGHRGHYHGVRGELATAGSISVIARRAAVADALTKCLLWCDPACEAALLRRFGARRLGVQNGLALRTRGPTRGRGG